MSKERLQQVRDELENILQQMISSPKIFDLFISSGGSEEKGYYFVLNSHPRITESAHAIGTQKHYEKKAKEFYHD